MLRNAAVSRTLRLKHKLELMFKLLFPRGADDGLFPNSRPRVGFSPKTPHWHDGMRMAPPPSLPCAKGTMPAATAAAEPPLDPPAVYDGFHGLRVGPCRIGSVVSIKPNSGALVRPAITMPACSIASMNGEFLSTSKPFWVILCAFKREPLSTSPPLYYTRPGSSATPAPRPAARPIQGPGRDSAPDRDRSSWSGRR